MPHCDPSQVAYPFAGFEQGEQDDPQELVSVFEAQVEPH
jgi:hypothetical protein